MSPLRLHYVSTSSVFPHGVRSYSRKTSHSRGTWSIIVKYEESWSSEEWSESSSSIRMGHKAEDSIVWRSGILRDYIAKLLWSRTFEGSKAIFHHDRWSHIARGGGRGDIGGLKLWYIRSEVFLETTKAQSLGAPIHHWHEQRIWTIYPLSFAGLPVWRSGIFFGRYV